MATPGVDGQWGVRGVDDDGNSTPDDISEAGHFGSDDVTLPIDEAFQRGLLPPLSFASLAEAMAFAESFGSDVILSNLLAFDVKAYDPEVWVQRGELSSDPVLPGDPGYRTSLSLGHADLIGRGGYVDLFWGRYSGLDWDAIPSPLPDMILTSALARPPHYLSQMYPLDPHPVSDPVVWGIHSDGQLPRDVRHVVDVLRT